ncbi:hypothetical protein OBBRIDRAFT_832536 [Obba rivulosa]|uniref:Nuclear GTPase SLIP-GC n=1 Tax=Obba rivulosa TaxID=1052685 RepID=A0A8E2J302_9APHY|nr:hypothetical protein OBBRIDRAFT_832536 [Obba rivulosa]
MGRKENEGMGANTVIIVLLVLLVAPTSVPDAKVKPEPQEHHLLSVPLTDSKTWRAQGSSDVSAGDRDVQEAPRLFVKPEPTDVKPAFLRDVSSTAAPSTLEEKKPIIKPEPVVSDSAPIDDDLRASTPPTSGRASRPQVVEPAALYKLYKFADDIDYLPEDALKEGLKMVKVIKANVNKIDMGSKLRRDVWEREIEGLQNQGAPTTMIAVCGATGAGKSSILNAILDDNIVPTSGMRACTAVVTEIGYHNKKTIDADVSFLSEQEWRQELGVLLDDLVDEDGHVKRANDLRSDAGVAWQKVHAVYPMITQDMLVKMSVDQIISRDPRIAAILGTTKHISAANSKEFAKEIAKYIDSKEKRGEKKPKKDKEKDKSKDKEPSLMDKVFKAALTKDTSSKKKDNDTSNDPAFWPLIRQVNVKCNARALSTGAILVDLPGVADANAARNNIAKDYMKKCDCIWILAPITRAVDDKTARDLMGDAFKMQLMMGAWKLSYDANAITFIATKCDDISCSEVIGALNLYDDADLVEVEEKIQEAKEQSDEWKQKKTDAESNMKACEQGLKQVREYLKEYEEHLSALENGREFVPRLTASSGKGKAKPSSGKKRKNARDGKKGSPKKQKTGHSDDEDDLMSVDDLDDFIVDDDDDEIEVIDSASDMGSNKEDSDDEKDSDSDNSKSGSESDEDEDAEEEVDEVTVDSLKAKIQEAKDALKAGRMQLNEFRKERKDAIDTLATLKKRQTEAQREKNAICSLRRSGYSRGVLKEDFRQGLKDLDDAAAEQRDPDSFDPTVDQRNYDEIDLPVFTCSARDYVRIKGQVKGDGDPTCFSKVEHTGIPELQQWCHHLTVSSRERAARNFLTHLKTFANSVVTYVRGAVDVTAADREALRQKWESSMSDDEDDDGDSLILHDDWESSDPFDLAILDALAHPHRAAALYTMRKEPPKVDRHGELVGVTPRLMRDFKKVVDDCVQELQRRFQDGLEEKCQTGAANAATAAVETSDTFAASMHWATYRATLRRHGSWRQDLNVELTNPFTRNIASSWSKVFEADLFASFEKSALGATSALMAEVEASAVGSLKDRAKAQAEICAEEARVALKETLELVRDTMNTEQKEVSRCLAPHVQNHLVPGYDQAMLERGTGSVARQKRLFHNYLDGIKDEVFEDAADVLMSRLRNAAEAVGKALETALNNLAEKIEVSLGVLWEGPRDDPTQVKVRVQVVATVEEIVRQLDLWLQAERTKRAALAAAAAEDGGMEN